MSHAEASADAISLDVRALLSGGQALRRAFPINACFELGEAALASSLASPLLATITADVLGPRPGPDGARAAQGVPLAAVPTGVPSPAPSEAEAEDQRAAARRRASNEAASSSGGGAHEPAAADGIRARLAGGRISLSRPPLPGEASQAPLRVSLMLALSGDGQTLTLECCEEDEACGEVQFDAPLEPGCNGEDCTERWRREFSLSGGTRLREVTVGDGRLRWTGDFLVTP